METEESQKLLAARTEGDPNLTMTDKDYIVQMPVDPDKITFEADEFMVGSDKLCMFGDWGIDFEKINTLEFIMGEKRDKKFVFKKV